MDKVIFNKIHACSLYAREAEGLLNTYCAKISNEIAPYLPLNKSDYEDFGVQWMTDGLCCYFDEMIVPVSFLAKSLYMGEIEDFEDIKKLAI